MLGVYRPKGESLRFIIAGIKLNTDLERIGDHCKNIAKMTPIVTDAPDLVPHDHFDRMVDAVRTNLYRAQDALLTRDRGLARRILEDERDVNAMHKQTLAKVLERNGNGGDASRAVVQLVNISKALERIADHSANIAESVVFWIEGVDLRHPKK